MSRAAHNAGDRALELALALRDLGREELAAIGAGSIDGMERFTERRRVLVESLQREMSAAKLEEGALKSVLRDVQTEAEQALTLLCALKAEIAGRLAEDGATRRALGGYGGMLTASR